MDKLKQLMKNKLLSSSIAYVLASFVVKGVSFFTAPIYTRLMSTSDYGIVSNFTTWVTFVAIFFFLQASSGLLPAKINRAPNRFDGYMKSIITFSLIVCFMQAVLLILLSPVVSKITSIDSKLIPFLCICGAGTCMTNVCSSYFVATEQVKRKVIFSIVTTLLQVAFGLAFVYLFSEKDLGRIYALTIVYGIVLIFGIVFFLRKPFDSKEDIKKDIKYALMFGIPLIPHLLANVVNGSADRVFIIKILGESEAGIYSVAYNIGTIVLILCDAFIDAWNPWYFNATKDKNINKISLAFKLYTITVSMFFVGLLMLAPEIMKFMAPSTYWSGTRCILYVAIGIFFLFLYRFPLSYEQFFSNTKFVAPATVLAAIINIGLNSVLIPQYGIEGAAIATTISYLALFVFHEIVARKIIKGFNISFKLYIGPISLVILAFVLSFILLDYWWIRLVILILFCTIYFLFIKKLINFNKKEKN